MNQTVMPCLRDTGRVWVSIPEWEFWFGTTIGVNSHRYGSHCYEKCAKSRKQIQRNKREPGWNCTRIKIILVSCKLKTPPKLETKVEQLSRIFNNILRVPGAVTPWFHESGANSEWCDFVYMWLVGNSDWHEVLTWDQSSLKIQFILYPPPRNASMPLTEYACWKQKSRTGLNSIHVYMVPQSDFRPLWAIRVSSAMVMNQTSPR